MNNIKKYSLLLGALTLLVLDSCTYDVLPEAQSCDILPNIELVSVTDAECNDAIGGIVVQSSSTEGVPLKFILSDGSENATGIFENLSAGNYTVQVETIDGCTNSLTADVINLGGININAESANTGCGSSTGSITISTEGGNPPYEFKIDDQSYQESSEFTALGTGTYTVFARDADGCEVSNNVEVKSDVTFSAVQAILTQNCISSNCHGGNQSPDFRVENNIITNAELIKSRTGSSSNPMPPTSSGLSLTDLEIQTLACWVDDGALR